jgi:hypothetical protein
MFQRELIGDIDGRLDCPQQPFDAIDRDAKGRLGLEAGEIYIGDRVDRGLDSMGVIEAPLARSCYCNAAFLRGNHEILFESFLRGLTRINIDAGAYVTNRLSVIGIDAQGVANLTAGIQ